ncbi:MAG: hypothetical protein IJC95_01410 [Clostridia bacterium]|nr:hypothetical protein [Oscillospiraceae bacterium]MBQ2773235.1 hypothetical protein [Clostridia bacterium]MBQ3056130.1 hypothetical protein [Clostridia bacterium]
MKRIFLTLIALSLLFCACGRNTNTPDITTVSNKILNALESKDNLTLADDDFLENNLSSDDFIDDCKIYIGDNKEIGILKLEENASKTTAERSLMEYLSNEASSISSLMTLYPSEALTEKLGRYQNATIVQKGRYICYFVLPEAEAAKAKSAFFEAFS